MDNHILELGMNPFQATLFVNQVAMIEVNSKNMFHFEHQRTRDGGSILASGSSTNEEEDAHTEDKHGGKKIVGYWEDGKYTTFLFSFLFSYPVFCLLVS